MTRPELSAPVAFLVFNRPDTTERVFEAIARARPKRLLIVADGPRADRAGEAERCEAVRSIVDRVDWDCEVSRNFSERNLGCKRRISSGLSWVFEQVDEAIILEDDCLPHPDFFGFADRMLARFRGDERVSMIGGTNYLLDRLAIEESYCFSRYFPIWGWATWRRAWLKYDLGMKRWPALKATHQLEGLYSERFMRRHLEFLFDLAHQGKIDTWDIQWFYSCLFEGGLSVVPRVNLISNIGVDGTHTGADQTNHNFPVFPLELDRFQHPEQVFPQRLYDRPFFEKKLRPDPLRKVQRKLRALKKRYL